MTNISLDENFITELVKRKIIHDTFRRLFQDKKSRIFQTAIKLFGEYGYDGLSVDRFCEEAGISKGSFFQYFPSKSHLLEFVILIFDNNFSRWIANIKEEEKAILARDRLLYLFQALAANSKLSEAEEKFFLFITSATKHLAVTIEGIDLERNIHEYIYEIIERGVQAGEIRSDFDFEFTGYLVSLIIGALIKRNYNDKNPVPEHIEEYLITFLFDGISI